MRHCWLALPRRPDKLFRQPDKLFRQPDKSVFHRGYFLLYEFGQCSIRILRRQRQSEDFRYVVTLVVGQQFLNATAG